MAKIDNYVTFVKEQVAVQEKLARKYDEDAYRSRLHFTTARTFADLARFLEDLRKRGTQVSAFLNRADTPQKRILLTFEEIENAPEELLKELNLTENDRQELLIEYMIAQAGGVLSLDKIIIELYARMKEVPKRTAVTQRLFRMANRGMIFNVPGKKGIYSTYELTEAEAKKMFGQIDAETEEAGMTPTPTLAAVVQGGPTPAAPSGGLSQADKDRLKTKLMGSASNYARR
jgi:hypothetical protein